jgi:uncharacterized protein (DUF58 family)
MILSTTEEIIRKVRELEIRSRRLASHIFSGEYHSAFKGRGMLFKEVREYQAGDDTRFIDWNVSARFGHPYSKVFEEERELTVMLLVDISASGLFGTLLRRKKDLITEICALLAFAAINNNDKVGVVFFSDQVEWHIPPKKGRDHVLYIVRELLTVEPKSKGTDLSNALRFFHNTTRQKSIAFILSDFIVGDYEDALRISARKHDVTGIKVYDRMDMQLPDVGLLQLEDAETGELRLVDTDDTIFRQMYAERSLTAEEACKSIFLKSGADLLHMRTDDDHVRILQRFFKGRK